MVTEGFMLFNPNCLATQTLGPFFKSVLWAIPPICSKISFFAVYRNKAVLQPARFNIEASNPSTSDSSANHHRGVSLENSVRTSQNNAQPSTSYYNLSQNEYNRPLDGIYSNNRFIQAVRLGFQISIENNFINCSSNMADLFFYIYTVMHV